MAVGPELQIARWVVEILWEQRTNFDTWEEYIEWLNHLALLGFDDEEGDF